MVTGTGSGRRWTSVDPAEDRFFSFDGCFVIKMTDYFEVVERDGAARLGELRLTEPITTPALVGDVIEDYGSLWTSDRESPKGDPGKVTLLPHRAMPAGTPEEIAREKQVTHEEVDFPSAAVVGVDSPEPMGQDLYVLTGLQDGNSRRVFEAVKHARESLKPDSCLMLPAAASPRNVAILSYLGVDAYDEDHAVVRGKQRVYMTREIEVPVEELEELPCSCHVCRDSAPSDLGREDVAQHNLYALRAELGNVRDKIRNGVLRDYVEGQARSARWMTEALRLGDQDYSYMEERAAVARQSNLQANSSESLDRVEIRRFMSRVLERYRTPRSDVAVLLPCSARKPYSESKSHGEFQSRIRGRAHEVVVTSPLGVVPRELESVYPAAHYDTPVTGRWDAKEHEVVGGVLKRYLECNSYDRLIAHLPGEGYGEIVAEVADDLGLDVEYTAENLHPRDNTALEALDDALEGEERANRAVERKWYVRGVTDYQFGQEVFDRKLGLSGVRTGGRIPRLRVFHDDTQIATVAPRYGYLALTLEGGRLLPALEVEIDGFVPSGSVLAPGVLDADTSIRVGDEVLFEGPEAWGVGRAKMYGGEMAASTRGVAVDVRHVEEK